MRYPTDERLRLQILRRLREAGGYHALGRELGLNGTYLARVATGRGPMTVRVAEALGYRVRPRQWEPMPDGGSAE